jgi:hypothetical protein
MCSRETVVKLSLKKWSNEIRGKSRAEAFLECRLSEKLCSARREKGNLHAIKLEEQQSDMRLIFEGVERIGKWNEGG